MSNPMWAPPTGYPAGTGFPAGPTYPVAAPVPTPAPVPSGPNVRPGRRAPKLFQPVVLKDAVRFYQVPAMAWWWGLLGLVAFGGLFLGVEILVGQVMYWADSAATTQNRTTPTIFLLNNAWIIALIPLVVFVSYWFYRQGFGWLSSVTGRFRWKWFLVPLGIFIVGYIIENLIEFVLYGPDGYGLTQLTWQPTSIVMIVGILLTTPFQSAAEEFMARGLVSRLIAGIVPQRQLGLILAALGSSGLFMYLHSADDLWLNCYYFSTGLVMWWAVYRTGGLEVSIALHIVNNLFSEWMLPFQDISDMFDRSAGTGSPVLLIYVFWEFLLVLIVDYIARGRGIVRMSAPAAAVPLVMKGGHFVPRLARQTAVATAQDLPRLATTPRLPASPAPTPNQWFAPTVGYPYPVPPSPAAMPVFVPMASAYPAAPPAYPAAPPAYPAAPPAYPAAPPAYPAAPPAYPAAAPAPMPGVYPQPRPYPAPPPSWPAQGYPPPPATPGQPTG